MTLNNYQIKELVAQALKEDIGSGDITTETLISPTEVTTGYIKAKATGVIAGLEVVKSVFEYLNSNIELEYLVQEGEKVNGGTKIATIKGPTAAILTGERVALNFLQRLSGVATKTAQFCELVKDHDVRLVDTRKTTPGLRSLEKYAVKIGGGHNHRSGLYDAVMIKDNHITAVGSIIQAVKQARESISHTTKIEVETESLAQVKEALQEEVDIIMLDNMEVELMKEAVSLIGGQAISEASGGINRETIQSVAETGVDVISLGTLTHTINALDISLMLEES